MDVGIVKNSPAPLQLASATIGQAKATAQPLQEAKTAHEPGLAVMDHVIDAMENGRSLEMYFDKDISRVVVQVIDDKTGKVVFQVPSDQLLNSIKSFRNYLKAARKGV